MTMRTGNGAELEILQGRNKCDEDDNPDRIPLKGIKLMSSSDWIYRCYDDMAWSRFNEVEYPGRSGAFSRRRYIVDEYIER